MICNFMTNLGCSKSLLFMWEIAEYAIELLMHLFTMYMWMMSYAY